MRHPHLDQILAGLRSYLQDLYGDRLLQIILYGSQARGNADLDSDIDVLVVLKDSFDFGTEVKRTNDFIADLCLECAVLVSVAFAGAQQVESAKMPFFLNVRREGIVVRRRKREFLKKILILNTRICPIFVGSLCSI